jgi:hypothetical protein
MSIVDDIAAGVPPMGKGAGSPTEERAEGEGSKPGDHGKRIAAALGIKEGVDYEALENAIKDCVEDASY